MMPNANNPEALMPKHYKYIILCTFGVSFIAFAVFGSQGEPLPYWGVFAVMAIGVGCGLAAYGFTSLLVEWRESSDLQELKHTIVEKFKKAYRK